CSTTYKQQSEHLRLSGFNSRAANVVLEGEQLGENRDLSYGNIAPIHHFIGNILISQGKLSIAKDIIAADVSNISARSARSPFVTAMRGLALARVHLESGNLIATIEALESIEPHLKIHS